MSEPASLNGVRPSFRRNAGTAICSFKPNARFRASSRSISIESRLSEAKKLALATLIVLLAAQFGAAQDTKLYVVTHVDLTPPYIADGTPLLLKFAADSRKEKSAARFELLQEPGRKNHFTIVSVWENQA